MAEGYEVGSVFLQVIPSYRGFIDSIREQARAARGVFTDEFGKGDKEMRKAVDRIFDSTDFKTHGAEAAEKFTDGFNKGVKGIKANNLLPDGDVTKAGERAGKNYSGAFERSIKSGISGALRDLPAVDVKINDAEAKREIEKIRSALERLNSRRIGVDLSAAAALRGLEDLRARLAALRDKNLNIDANFDFSAAEAKLEAFLSGLKRDSVKVPVDAELGAGAREVQAKLKALLSDIGPIKIDANSSDAERKIAELRAKLQDVEFRVRVGETGAHEASAEIEALIAELEVLRAMPDIHKDIKFDVDKGLANFKGAGADVDNFDAKIRKLGNSLKDNGSSFRIFNFGVLGIASVLPAVIPLLAAATGAALGLGAAFATSAAGIGVLGLAFRGVGDALTAYQAQDKQAATQTQSSARAQEQAARTIRDAQQGLARARQDAADAATDSARRIADAEQGVVRAQEAAARAAKSSARAIADAQKGVQDATQAVSRAQENAARDAEQSARRIADAQRDAAEAVQNLARVQQQAARDAAQAARRVADAEQAAADARVSADRSVQSALRSVESAERSYANAQKQSLRAQQDLNAAREDAKRNLEDMNNALTSGAIREQQAVLDLQEAALSLNAVLEDPQATVRERKAAQLAYDAQAQSLKELRLQNQRLQEDTTKANAAGVEGSDQVVAARERISDAAQAEIDSQRALTQARQDAAQAQVDAARRIADADRNVADAREAQALQAENSARAIADAQQRIVDTAQKVTDAQNAAAQSAADNARAIQDAQDRVAESIQRVRDAEDAAAQSAADSARSIKDAQQGVADAREAAARQARDSAQSIADAEQRVADANQSAADGMAATNAAAANLAYALSQLSPAGRDFVNFIRGEFLPYLQQLQFAAQEGFLPKFTDSIQILLGQYGPGLLKFVGQLASILGDLAIRAANLLISPTFQDFFATVAKYAPSILDSLGKIAGGLSTAFAILFTAFAPLGDKFLQFLAGAAYQFAALMQSFVDSQAFQDFIAYINQSGPALGALVVALVEAFLNLAEALAPVGLLLVEVLTGVLNFIADMDPATLRLIVVTILSLVVGVQAMAGVMIVLGSAMAGALPFLLGIGGVASSLGPVLLLVGASVAALVGAFIALASEGGHLSGVLEPLARYFDIVWTNIKKVASAFMEGLRPALGDVTGRFEGMGPNFQKVGDVIVKALGAISDYVTGVLAPVFKILGALIGLALSTIVTLVTGFVALVTGDWGKLKEILIEYGNDILKGLGQIFNGLYQFLVGITGQTVSDVTKAFRDLWNNAVQNVKNLYNGVVGFFTDLYDVLVGHSIVPDMVNAILGWFSRMWTNAVNFVKDLYTGVIQWFTNVYNGSVDLVNYLVMRVTNFFLGMRNDAIQRARDLYNGFIDTFTNLRDGIVGPNGLVTRFVAAALQFFTNMKNNIRDAINELPGIFTRVVDAIGTAWDKIKDKTKEPIRFVVNTVLNNGLLAGYNSIAKTFTGTDPQLKINLPQGFAVGGWTGPGSKYQPAGIVHADEFVIRKESQQRLSREAPGLLDYLNQHGRMPGYASGGIVDFGRLIQRQFGALVSEHPSFGGVSPVHAGRGHYEGRAIDVNTRPGTSALEQRELAPIVALAKSKGFYTIFMSAGHYNHAHIEDRGGVAGAFDDIASAIGNAAAAAKDAALGLVNGLGIDLSGFNFSGPFADVVKAVPGKLLGMAKDKLMSLAATVGDLLSPGSATDVPAGGAGAAGSNKEIVRSIANGYGWGQGAQWDALVALVNSESGFRNTAQNPTSTAYGMFQFLNGTWAGLGATKTSDPRLQAIAGLKYVAQRYGDPIKAWAFHRARGYYDDGGLVTPIGNVGAPTEGVTPTLYDTGGMVPPGLTTILNATGKPEAMLPPALVDAILSGSTDKQAPTMVTEMSGNFFSYDPTELAAEAERRRADKVAVAGLSNLAKGL